MNLKRIVSVAGLCLPAALAQGSSIWVDWSTGATQPFVNGSGGTGTVSYTHAFSSIGAASISSPDAGFPFTNPIKYLAIGQIPDSWIEFDFTGVAPDAQSIFTLGNLRPRNRFVISAFDSSGGAISLTTWTNHGEYRLFPNDTAPNLWLPATGELIGNGSPNENGMNIFLGLTAAVDRIRVDYDSVDGGFEFLDCGLAGGTIPAPGAGVLPLLIGALANRRRR